MSRIESYSGKLIPVDLEGLTVEEKCQQLCSATELPPYSRSWISHLEGEYYNEYYYDKRLDVLFSIEKENLDDDFILMTDNGDGSYGFVTRFHNGGAPLTEVLDDGMESI